MQFSTKVVKKETYLLQQELSTIETETAMGNI